MLLVVQHFCLVFHHYLKKIASLTRNHFAGVLRRYATSRRSAARRGADEGGSRAGSILASKGLSNSPLAAGIAAGQRRLASQRTEDILGAEQGQLESDLASAEEEVRIANAQDQREEIQGVGSAALALTSNVVTTDSPLRNALGLPELAPAPSPITINTGGGDSKGNGNASGNTPETVTTKKGTDIPQGSQMGEWYKENPDIIDELEELLGSDFVAGLDF